MSQVTEFPGPERKNLLERILSPIADIRRGEGIEVFVLALDVFLLLAAYYLLKTVRESLILSESGAANKTYASAVQAVLLIGIIPLFGYIASRVNRMRLIATVLGFFIFNLAVFYLVAATGAKTGFTFFIWVGIFNVMAISQFWAFANDLYTESQGKRLFPAVGIGSSLGAWLGAVAAKPLIERTGPLPMMLIAAAMLGGCIALTYWMQRNRSGRDREEKKAEVPLGREGGFELVFKDRYLLLILGLLILLNLVNTQGEYMLGNLVVDAAKQATAGAANASLDQKKFIGSFYADFFGWVNLVSFLLQTFLAHRIFKLAGVSGALFVLPLIAFGSYSIIVAMPVLAIVKLFKIAENSVDYSIQNTARHALFLPTSREAKYKAKQVIDSFGQRTGDVIAAGVVYFGTHNAWTTRTFGWVNIGLTLVWFVLVAAIAREYRRRAKTAEVPVEKAA